MIKISKEAGIKEAVKVVSLIYFKPVNMIKDFM